jgi:hypothetical protein
VEHLPAILVAPLYSSSTTARTFKGTMVHPAHAAQAVAEHPWWGGGRSLLWSRFFGWASGDWELSDLWPRLTYRTAPSGKLLVNNSYAPVL